MKQCKKPCQTGEHNLPKATSTQMKNWLIKNVTLHTETSTMPPDLIRKIAGKELNVKPYLSYLNEKYSKLYGF